MSIAARQPTLITREGHARLSAELGRLVTVGRRQAAERLRVARDTAEQNETGGVAEVLDAHAALEQRIGELQMALSSARIADPPSDGVAGIGQRVTLRFGEGTSPVEYHLVGAIEADPGTRRVSVDSPIGRALLGHRAGETVEVETPGGNRTVEIVAVGSER
jgi:transcription elongation factor GreA